MNREPRLREIRVARGRLTSQFFARLFRRIEDLHEMLFSKITRVLPEPPRLAPPQGKVELNHQFWNRLIDRIENLYAEILQSGQPQPKPMQGEIRRPDGAFRFNIGYLNAIIRRVEGISDWVYSVPDDDWNQSGSGN